MSAEDIKKRVVAILVKPENLKALDEYRLQDIYRDFYANTQLSSEQDAAVLTQILLDLGIDPLSHVEFIMRYMYYGLDIKEVILPGYIDKIDTEAFKACKNLKRVDMSGSKCSYIGNNAFCYCDNLEDVKFSSSLMRIDAGAFQNCGKLKQVRFPKGLKEIGSYAFTFCKSLEKIILPGVLKLGTEVFGYCQHLREVEIEEGLTRIEPEMFRNCPDLERLVLPSTLSFIGGYAFDSCYSLTDIEYKGTTERFMEIRRAARWYPSQVDRITIHCNGGGELHISEGRVEEEE